MKDLSGNNFYVPSNTPYYENLALIKQLAKDRLLDYMANWLKDYTPLKGSYEHLCESYELGNCKLLKFMIDEYGSCLVCIPISGSITHVIQNLSEIDTGKMAPEEPSDSVIYIMLYKDEGSYYIFNANSLITKYIEMYNEAVKKKQEEELPEINRIKGILNEIL